MEGSGQKDIRIVVEDENSLYSSFSPDDEFNEAVKAYIRSRLYDGISRQSINMTVIARSPIDEERFRAAVNNWIRDSKASFKKRQKEVLIRIIGSLIFGSILIIMSIAGQKQYDVIRYSLLPIMGSIALGEAARALIRDVPTIRIERWLFREIEKNSRISFEYIQ